MKYLKVLSLILACLIILLSFGACSSNSKNIESSSDASKSETNSASKAADNSTPSTASSGENQTITFWNVFTGSDGDILGEIVDKYNKENSKGIKIEMTIMPNDQLQQKLPASIATNTAPNMVLYGVENIAPYVSSDSLEDISDFWDTMGVDKSNFLDSVVTLSQIDGKQYGTPMQYNLMYLYWNKDRFEEVGLDSESPPKTLDELADYAVKLTDISKNQYGLALPVGATVTYPQFLWANGGDIDDSSTGKNLLNSEANLKTLTWLQDLTVNKKVSPENVTGMEADTMLQNGQVAMYMSGPWQINGLRTQGINFGITSVPGGSAGAYSPEGGCAYVIPKGISSEKKAAAYEFMKYWLTDDILKEWSMRNGFPVWSKTLEKQDDIKNDAVLSAISEASEIGRSYNLGYSLASQIDRDAIGPMFESVISGSAAPEDALQKASDKLDEILKK